MHLILTILFLVVAAHVVLAVSIFLIAKKAGLSNLWMAWIPVANFALLCRTAGKSGWLALLLIVPLINLLFVIYVAMGVSRALGKSPLLGLAVLAPGVGLLIFPYLAVCDEPWMQANWKWAVPLILLASVGGLAGFVLSILGTMKSSDAYQLALSQARSAPSLTDRLGAPIDPGWYVLGQVSLKNDGGDAALSFPVSGPKGKAAVIASAVRERGVWRLKMLAAKISKTGEQLSLLTPASAAIKPPSPPAPLAAPAPPVASTPPASAAKAAPPAASKPPVAAAVPAPKPAEAPSAPALPAPLEETQAVKPPARHSINMDELSDSCGTEIGIICHDVPPTVKTLLRCLRDNEDNLMAPCRNALNRR